MEERQIVLKDVRTHNLKSVSLTLNTNELIVFTGVSGSGKSSFAFDTLYVEGQRRYVASLSNYARRQLGDLAKPEMESADGISPTISIEQKTAGRNPRSTVGTMTEIYDYLRVLYARVSTPHCPVSGEPVSPQSRERIIQIVQNYPEGTKLIVLAPYARNKKGAFKEDFENLLRRGYMRVKVDGDYLSLDEEIALDGSVSHNVDIVVDRIAVSSENHSRVAEAITNALELGQGICSVVQLPGEEEVLFSMHAYSPASGISYTSLEPQDFSFNSPVGMCEQCEGLGTSLDFDLDKVIDPNLSIAQDCCSIASSYQTVKFGNIYDNLAEKYHFSVKTPWKKLSQKAKEIFLYGTEEARPIKMHFVHPHEGYVWSDYVLWKGVLYEAKKRYTEATSEAYRKKMQPLMKLQTCPKCHGNRLKAYPAAAQLGGKTISAVCSMTVEEGLKFFEHLTLSTIEQKIAAELLKEICERLRFLIDVGLHYLTLDRTAPTLSGGEAQRVRLASQIGCGLVGITYILDEPSIGLHPRDNSRLIATLKHLRDIGNTVIVVEHDEETIEAADTIVDFGPGAGTQGGKVVYHGSLSGLLQEPQSLTGAYLSGRETIKIPKKRRKPSRKKLKIVGATHHNLKNVNVSIPLGVLTCVTGVSGSGKSSLVTDILYPALSHALHGGEMEVGAHKSIQGIQDIDKVIAIDQTPIGRNPRSNPATYIKLFDEIRDLFSNLPESLARGYKPGRFSFNVKEGSCPHCQGMGMLRIDMDFLEDDWIECPQCEGRRFDHETLSVFYKGKSIYDILEMDITEALEFFQNIPKIRKKLEMLHRVGMDYIKLGQSSTTLSGGEAQRVKLAKELVRPSTGNTLYILDEPTTGLHFHDIKHLLEVLHELVDRGNTVLIIEHNMDVVKTADWIIDLGPDGGEGGGQILAEAPPEKVARMETPSGQAIRAALERKPLKPSVKTPKMQRTFEEITTIDIERAEQNNLKSVSVTIPRQHMTVCTGPSGSGKSSFAFETVYAEGQRRYAESLSPYARQFIKQMPKPKVGRVAGLSPAIAIEQRVHAGNPRSTVGTMTEVYDFLRILYARVGTPHCPETGEVIRAISKDHVVARILDYPEGEKIQILAPIEVKQTDNYQEIIQKLQRQGYVRIRLNGEYYDLDEALSLSFNKKRTNELMLVVDRLVVNPTIHHRLFEAVENAAAIGNQKMLVARPDGDHFFNLAFAVESTGKSYPEITPQTFAFNLKEGMCPACEGIGYQYGANLTTNPTLMQQSLRDLMENLWEPLYSNTPYLMLQQVAKEEKIPIDIPLSELSDKHLQFIFNGSEKVYRYKKQFRFSWKGINHVFAQLAKSHQYFLRQFIDQNLDKVPCLSCGGGRLNPLASHVTIHDIPIQVLCAMPLEKAYAFVSDIPTDSELLEDVKQQALHRLSFLVQVGLHYISLNRSAPTLSGGETQRTRLARQLGSGLTGVLYVLDEPTIGLHPHDNTKLNQALRSLKELGNTLLLVEHDPLTIAQADYILDFGPHSGHHGGHVTAQGSFKQILKNSTSLTGAYLSGRKNIPVPKKRKTDGNGSLTLSGAKLHNLKNVTATFPLNCLTCVTGVSGSGKSTLVHDLLVPALKKGIQARADLIEIEGAQVKGINQIFHCINIDQSPIGTTVRSNVGTYVGVLDLMRQFFSFLPEAQAKGLKPGNFSFNHPKGRCSTCFGLGYRRIEMHFLPAVEVECEACRGLRLNPVSLEVMYQGKNFGQYLKSTIEEVRVTFADHPRIVRILNTLIDVGLGYLTLGQEMATLSGGEAQRIKLGGELSKRYHEHTIYIMDEPTTGLHSDDIEKLLTVMHRLVDAGSTMIVIEHNLDVIKNADYIIDIGPEAGEFGGEIIAAGTPEQIMKVKRSLTGHYLREVV
ncbi:MAG: excinuclease ABC subunit UvrA [Chlamydiales bacterium]